jgi:hypothetical protein
MSTEAMTEFIKFLGRFDPPWVIAILAIAILCYRAPDIVRAFKGKK